MTLEATLEDETYDPFAAFDSALGSETVRNPYPTFAERRRENVIEGGTWGLFHEDGRM